MDRDDIRNIMIELIEEVMPEIEEVAFNRNIVAEYGVNSVSIIKLIVAAEKRFDIEFSDYELALDGYRTFEDMVVLIYEKLEDKE
ncbi:MAG: acyl carrier protein [Eubacterium sp.]|nr:acyl carrier protein [Eubacterium sp.]